MEHSLIHNRIGILTSGSGAPGINAAIYTLHKLLKKKGIEILGFRNGLAGILKKDYETSLAGVDPVIGGSHLGFGYLKEIVHSDIRKKIASNIEDLNLDSLIVFGGDGTLKIMSQLAHESGVNSLVIPATVENDVPGVDRSLGFDTIVSSGALLVDRIMRTENPVNSVVIVEVLGKDWGMGAIEIGLACEVDDVFVPEVPFSLDEVVKSIRNRQEGKNHRPFVYIVGEGQKTGRDHDLAEQLRKKIPLNIKICSVSEVQRAGEPNVSDRILATKYSVKVVEFLFSGKKNLLVAYQNKRFSALPYQELSNTQKRTPQGLLRLLKELNR